VTTLTVDVPNELLAKIKQSGRSVQELIVESLERTLNDRAAISLIKEPTKDEIVQRLAEAKLIYMPNTWDSPAAQAWRDLPEDEKAQHLEERLHMRFAGSPAASAIIEERR